MVNLARKSSRPKRHGQHGAAELRFEMPWIRLSNRNLQLAGRQVQHLVNLTRLEGAGVGGRYKARMERKPTAV